MKCRNCPFHLVCHAGCLEYKLYSTSLCPECGKLSFVQPEPGAAAATAEHPSRDNSIVMFFCEQRPSTRSIRVKFEEIKRGSLNKTGIAQFRIVDTGPNPLEFLVVRECVVCTQIASRFGFVIRDLDEEAEIRQELAPNPLALRGKS